MVLFTLKLTAASTIAFEFFANVIAVKFLGNLADVPYFCKLCNLLRIIIKYAMQVNWLSFSYLEIFTIASLSKS